jgi:hypothetical protein
MEKVDNSELNAKVKEILGLIAEGELGLYAKLRFTLRLESVILQRDINLLLNLEDDINDVIDGADARKGFGKLRCLTKTRRCYSIRS